MKRELTCIICPRGCSLVCKMDDMGFSVTGNACPKGEQYAHDECINPIRTVTSIIRISNREDMMVSVKTDRPIRKSDIFNAMNVINSTSAEAPIKIGEVLIKDVFGANIVATRDID